MKIRPFAWAVAIAAMAPFALATPRAAADNITLNFLGGTIDQKITYDGKTSTVGGGPFNWTVQSVVPASYNIAVGSTVQTWCVELTQSFNSPVTYNITSISNLANSTAVQNLFGIATHDGLISSDPAAMQLAIWELITDTGDAYNPAMPNYNYMGNGNLQYSGSNSTVKADANSLVSQALYDTANGINAFAQYLNGYTLYDLQSKTMQDQVLLVPPCPTTPPPPSVPAPPAALLAVFGVMALGGRAAWFRKKPVAA